MKINIINAYLSHTLEVVAIATDRYYVLKAKVSEKKGNDLVKKINEIRVIEDTHWDMRHD